MIKIVTPMKRRPGISVEEFREYYEKKHKVIGEKYLTGFASKYVRRFTNPLPNLSGKVRDPDFDVILEVWYPDMETFNTCIAKLTEPNIAKEIREDEAKLFDLNYKRRSYVVEEFESDLKDSNQ